MSQKDLAVTSRSSATLCWAGVSKLVGSKAMAEDSPVSANAPLALPGGRLERLPELFGCGGRTDLIEAVGAGAVRRFWATFAAVDLPHPGGARRWTPQEWSALSHMRWRCLAATAPFSMVLSPGHVLILNQIKLSRCWFWPVDADFTVVSFMGACSKEARRLLEENWLEAGREEEEALLRVASTALDRKGQGNGRQGTEVLVKSREAAAAAKASEQWKVLLAVQHLIGRPSSEKVPGWKDMQQELHRKRERLLEQARTFMLIGSLLGSGGDAPKMEERCLLELRRLLAVQRLVPEEWRR
ncbi:unnamed protein product [Effrenium voratum]|nr:unnamed protein product [Effrenium voratum]